MAPTRMDQPPGTRLSERRAERRPDGAPAAITPTGSDTTDTAPTATAPGGPVRAGEGTVLEKATGLRMDPRIARRWVEVRREQGRRRLRILIAAGSVLAAVALFAGSLYTPIFKVRHVRVVVAGTVASSKVQALSGITGRSLMIRVNDSAVERRLDAVANLGEAHVATHWPGTVSISVVERVPVAVVPVGGQAAQPASQTGISASQWAEIDQTGRVIGVVGVRPAGLPVLVGTGAPPGLGQWIDGSAGESSAIPRSGDRSLADMNALSATPSVPTGIAAMLAIAAALPVQIRQTVGTIMANGPTGLTMTVAAARGSAGPLTVHFGDGSRLAAKLTALATLLTQADLTGVTGLDLTVPDRPAALTAQSTPYSLSTHAGGSH